MGGFKNYPIFLFTRLKTLSYQITLDMLHINLPCPRCLPCLPISHL